MLTRSNLRRIENNWFTNLNRRNVQKNNLNIHNNNLCSQTSLFHKNPLFRNHLFRDYNNHFFKNINSCRNPNKNLGPNINFNPMKNVNPNNHNNHQYSSLRQNPNIAPNFNTNRYNPTQNTPTHIRNRVQPYKKHLPNLHSQISFPNLTSSTRYTQPSKTHIPRPILRCPAPSIRYSESNLVSDDFALDDYDIEYSDDDDEDSLCGYRSEENQNGYGNSGGCICGKNSQTYKKTRVFSPVSRNISCPNSSTNLAFSPMPSTLEPFSQQPLPQLHSQLLSPHSPSFHDSQPMQYAQPSFPKSLPSSFQLPFPPLSQIPISNIPIQQTRQSYPHLNNYIHHSLPRFPFPTNYYPFSHQQTPTFPPPQTFLPQPPTYYSPIIQQNTSPNSFSSNTLKGPTYDLVNCINSLIKQQVDKQLKQSILKSTTLPINKPTNPSINPLIHTQSKPLIHQPFHQPSNPPPNPFWNKSINDLNANYSKNPHHNIQKPPIKINASFKEPLISATDTNTGEHL